MNTHHFEDTWFVVKLAVVGLEPLFPVPEEPPAFQGFGIGAEFSPLCDCALFPPAESPPNAWKKPKIKTHD